MYTIGDFATAELLFVCGFKFVDSGENALFGCSRTELYKICLVRSSYTV